MAIYAISKRADLNLSGPNVWPKLTAELAADRFIFRRPELAYLEGLRRMADARRRDSMDPEVPILLAKVYRIHFKGPKKRFDSISDIMHDVQWADRLEDVRRFLSRLRTVLVKHMPDDAALDQGVLVKFIDADTREQAVSFQERWV